MVQHRYLGDIDKHEPTGIESASADQVYVADGADGGAWTSVNDLPITAFETVGVSAGWDEKTDNYTLVIGDVGKTIGMNAATAKTITIPLNSSVAFSVGTYINFARSGAGSVQIVADGGVTLRAPNGAYLNAQYSVASLVKKATDEWYLAGDLGTS